MTAGWNFADVWETVAATTPDAIAQVHGERRDTWRAFDARANGLAARLLAAGFGRHDKVALYLTNTPAYLETAYAVMKAGLVPVNTNYRYRHDELHYLWDNADAVCVVFDARFTRMADEVRARCPKVKLWLRIDDPAEACPAWAESYAAAAERSPGRTRAPWGRSGDDPIFIYTGGTTGRPKGVMWRQHDLYLASNTTDDPEVADTDHVRRRIAASTRRPVGLSAAPLMHGTGFVFAASVLTRGGHVVTEPETTFDAARVLGVIAREGVTDLCIVGDAFARPMTEALDAEPGRFDLASLKVISSSGMMWSKETKSRLLAHAPQVLMIDFLNSSEASGMGRAITSGRSRADGARFQLGRNAFVIDEAGRPIAPGSGGIGRVAVRGTIPLGYYKDPVKTAATFPVIDGVRCAVPGDYATVEADGTITLLGRGSTSINSGGEKVFPEEVEEAIKTHPLVRDAVVVGVPDPRLGQAVAAMVVTTGSLDAETLRSHVRKRLAGYKTPRHVFFVESVERTPSGKADYPAVLARARALLGSS